VLATPYLVVRHVRRHLAERRPTEGSTSITPAIAPAELPGPQLG